MFELADVWATVFDNKARESSSVEKQAVFFASVGNLLANMKDTAHFFILKAA